MAGSGGRVTIAGVYTCILMLIFYYFYFYIHEYYNVLISNLPTSLYPSMVFPAPILVPVVGDVRNSDSRRHPCSYIDSDQVVVPLDRVRMEEEGGR